MNKPRVQSVAEEGGRVIAGRLRPGTDLLPGLLEACREHGVTSGTFMTVMGSLKQARFVYVMPKADSPIGVGYGDAVQLDLPVEVLTAQGTIGVWEDGTPSIHMHALLIDTTGALHGGHMLDEGNPTLATIEFSIRELPTTEVVRRVEEEIKLPVFSFVKK